jgi:hypothetical protein
MGLLSEKRRNAEYTEKDFAIFHKFTGKHFAKLSIAFERGEKSGS